MTSPTMSKDGLPRRRSREENQERAFIAASRRKDRALDVRLESAKQASALHKGRTGKALRITRQIVEDEAIYEEIDERYENLRSVMLSSINTNAGDCHLLPVFVPCPAIPNPTPLDAVSPSGASILSADQHASYKEGGCTSIDFHSNDDAVEPSPSSVDIPSSTFPHQNSNADYTTYLAMNPPIGNTIATESNLPAALAGSDTTNESIGDESHSMDPLRLQSVSSTELFTGIVTNLFRRQDETLSVDRPSVPLPEYQETVGLRKEIVGERLGRKSCGKSARSLQSSTCNNVEKSKVAKRAAHNVVEQRYRAKMNMKFRALEEAIRPVAETGACYLKKSEILAKTIDYIARIQQEHRTLSDDIAHLKRNSARIGE